MIGESPTKKTNFFGWKGDVHCLLEFPKNILADYLKKSTTVTDAYYAALLDHLKDELKEKRPTLAHKRALSPGQRAVPQMDHRNGKLA